MEFYLLGVFSTQHKQIVLYPKATVSVRLREHAEGRVLDLRWPAPSKNDHSSGLSSS